MRKKFAWKIEEDILSDQEEKICRVVYIGGGNALIIFDSEKEDKRKEIVEKFTRKLLTDSEHELKKVLDS